MQQKVEITLNLNITQTKFLPQLYRLDHVESEIVGSPSYVPCMIKNGCLLLFFETRRKRE